MKVQNEKNLNEKKSINKKMYNERKGITLIALVITIIVLLILAGISIATLTGDNGILTKAMEANNKTKEANLKEELELTIVESISDVGASKVFTKNLEKDEAYFSTLKNEYLKQYIN